MLSTGNGSTFAFTSGILGSSGDSVFGRGGNRNPLGFIEVDNTESVVLLKDADATFIHYSHGANGVILITTKKAANAKGKKKIELNIQQGWGKVTRILI